jgi:hypothetical protein
MNISASLVTILTIALLVNLLNQVHMLYISTRAYFCQDGNEID